MWEADGASIWFATCDYLLQPLSSFSPRAPKPSGCPPLRAKDILMSVRCSLAWDKAALWLLWLARRYLQNTSTTLFRVYRAYKLQSSQELRCDLQGRLLECSLFSLWWNGFLSHRVLATSRTKWYAKMKKKSFTCRQLINIPGIGHVLWQTALIYSDMPGLSHSRHPYAAPLNHEAVKLGCTPTSFKNQDFFPLSLCAVSLAVLWKL